MINKTLLVSAYACEPLKGSEQGVGWNWVLQMAKCNKLHVITRANNQDPIEDYLPKDIAENITFYYYDAPALIKDFKSRAKGLYLYYTIWQIGIIPCVSQIIKKHDINYTMHLTMGSIWMPTFLPFFKIPFIWGPVGGGEGIPKAFLQSMPIKQRLVQALRYLLKYMNYINPLFIYTCLKSSTILIRTNNTLEYIPAFFRYKTRIILETSIENRIFDIKKSEVSDEVVRLVTTGRLIPLKNVITIINALQMVPTSYNFCLTIIGSGSEKHRIAKQIENANLLSQVELIEEIPRENVLRILSKSDIYLFPSLKEGGSWALMEAMAIGLPVICLKWSGMEIITDDSSAIRLQISNPTQMTKDFARAICELIDNPKLRNDMGRHARERIRSEFNWDEKGVFMNNLLRELDEKKN